MKMKILFFVLTMTITALVSSCSKNDDVTYSCNKEVNKWVKDNFTEIQQMNVEQFVSMNSLDMQRGVYNAFTAKQRQNIWFNKFDAIVKLNWTEKEKNHIESLIEIVKSNPYWFDSAEATSEMRDEMEIWVYKWKEYAKEELGWGIETIYAIAGTPNSVYRKTNRLIVQEFKPILTKSNSENDCYCHAGSWMDNADFCTLVDCYISDCSPADSGCGWLWSQSCNGECKGI